MRKKAGALSTTSMTFLMVTDQMRTDLDAIPEDPSDKNYVDLWYEKQTAKFQKEHSGLWAKICKKLADGEGRKIVQNASSAIQRLSAVI